MLFLKQSTASQAVLLGPFVDDTDGATAETGLTIANTDVRLSANGGNMFAKTSGGGTHDENGWYTITLDATDTATVGRLQISCKVAGALAVFMECQVVEEVVYAAWYENGAVGYITDQPVNTTKVGGTTQTAGDIPALVTTVDTVVDGIQTDLSNGTDGLGALKAIMDTSGVVLTAAAVDAIWDEDLSPAHDTAGSAGKALQDAGSAGDPWSTALPGAYGAGTAGEILGDWKNAGRLDAILDTIAADVVNIDGIVPAAAGDAMTLTAAGVDLIWDEVLTGATHNVTSSAGKRLRQIDAGFEVLSGTATAGTANTITFESGASTTNDIYNGDRIVITAGTGAGEHGLILDYDGGTLVATMSKNWVVPPDATSEYIVLPADADVELWNDNAVTGDGDWAALKAETAAILDDTDLIDDGTSGLAKIATDAAAILDDTGTNGVALLTATQASIDAIETDTSTTLQAELDGIQADTEDIQSRLPAALVSGRMSSDVVAVSGDTTAADNLEASLETMLVGTATGGTTSTVTSALTGYGDDTFIGRVMLMRTGTLQFEAAAITDYDSTAGTFTFAASSWTTSPTTETFVIV